MSIDLSVKIGGEAGQGRLDLLIGLNQETFDLHRHELKDKGLAIIEGETGKKNKRHITVPFNAFGKQAGNKI